MRKYIAAVIVLIAGLIAGVAYANDNPGHGNDNAGDKVTLCHATGSSTNPFVEITVNANGAIHGHAGSDHQDGRDIIPPFSYNDHGKTVQFPGQNYDAKGKATLANGCRVPSTTTTGTTTGSTTTVGTTTSQTTTTTKTVTSPTVTVPGSTTTGPSTTVPGSTVTSPTTTVPGSTVTRPTTTLPGKTVKPPVKKHPKPKPHLPKPPKKVTGKTHVFPYTP